MLAALGHEVTATGFAGGPVGPVVRGLLARSPGVVDALVPCAGTTRRTVAVTDDASGDTTQFNEPGPLITPAEWSLFLARYEELVHTARAVALCGSLPPGVPVGAYAVLVRTARAAGVPVLLDTSGEALRRGVAARPEIIKPNAAELAELTGSRDPHPATRDARRRGAHAVVTSLGPDGLLAATPEGTWQAAPPRKLSGNPTGSRRLRGRGPAVGPGGGPGLCGPPHPRGRPVGGHGPRPGGGRIRPRPLRGAAARRLRHRRRLS